MMIEKLNIGAQCKILPNQSAMTLPDVSQQLLAALDSPSDFPRLCEAVVPGDHIAIAVSRQIPQISEILCCLVDYLTANQIELDDISIVLPSRDYIEISGGDDEPTWQRLLDSVRITYQRNDDPNNLAFLAPDREGNPVYVSRDLFDADMVIPVLRNDQWSPSSEQGDGLVKDYCFRERFAESNAKSDNARFDADEVHDQLGIFFICEVIVGPGRQINNILAGNRKAVGMERQKQLQKIWKIHKGAEPDLVIATIEGDRDEQNWFSITRAVDSAVQISESCPIVVLTESREKPNRKLRNALSPQQESIISSDYQPLVDTVGRRPLHLLSRLNAETVEDLGLGYVSDESDVQRLIDNAENCVVLRDAHRCRIE